MSKIQTPKKPETPKQTEPQKREIPIWCRGITGGCVNCGGSI